MRRECLHREGWIGEDPHTRLNEGENLMVEKIVVLHTSRDNAISEAGLAARRAVREAGFEGAMSPWQSGSDGREESQQLHLNPKSGRWIPDNTHRQRHINAAVAYNIWHYIQATDDLAFLAEYGAEMLVEISRFWASIACYNEAQCRYEIHHVMGPDEYHTAYPDADPEAEGGLGNNAYTNVMASWVLMCTLDALQLLPENRRRQLGRRLKLGERELRHWET